MNQAMQSGAVACAAIMLESLPAFMQRLRQLMRDVRGGLTVPQFRVLAFLERHPGSTLAEVAEFIGIGKPTASAMIATLSGKRLVERIATADRRSAALHASVAGRKMIRHARTAAQQRVAQRLTTLESDDLAMLARAFRLLDTCFATDSTITGT